MDSIGCAGVHRLCRNSTRKCAVVHRSIRRSCVPGAPSGERQRNCCRQIFCIRWFCMKKNRGQTFRLQPARMERGWLFLRRRLAALPFGSGSGNTPEPAPCHSLRIKTDTLLFLQDKLYDSHTCVRNRILSAG